MHYDCILVDDEAELAQMTCEYFQMFDVSCTWTRSAEGCLALLKEHTADLLLLDINLPGESGFLLCKKLRETSDIPILFLSARQSDEDVLTSFVIGGDDYVKKPCPLSVLLAKVRVMQKRMVSHAPEEAQDALKASREEIPEKAEKGSLYLEEGTFSVFRNGKEIRLRAREFRLLQCLMEHKNTIVTKEQLFKEVWGDDFYSDGTLNVHIRRLREKIEEDPNEPKRIQTVWGTGYLLEME